MRRAGFALAVALTIAPTSGVAQDRGAAALHQLVSGITVTPRVLLIGAHPDDGSSSVMAWLTRGRQVQTAFISLTRGEGASNHLGGGTGHALAVIRTMESLQARRVDGGLQYFGRMYDFGFERDTVGLFKRWDRDSVLADIVTVIRSFRPQVILTPFGSTAGAPDPQHIALLPLARDAFAAASDTVRFPARQFGYAWAPSKLYRAGGGAPMDLGEIDRALGVTYGEIGLDASSKHRSQGLTNVESPPAAAPVGFTRVIPEPDSIANRETSILDGIDTTFARLTASAPDSVAAWLRLLVAHADSAAAALDPVRPDSAVRHLARVTSLAGLARSEAAWCRHPAAVIQLPSEPPTGCDQRELDLDASIDLVRERATGALLAAAGVAIEQDTRRERIAESDTGMLVVRIRNNGVFPVTLEHVHHESAVDTAYSPVAIASGRTHIGFRRVAGLGDGSPWWVKNLADNRFPETPSLLDGGIRSPRFRMHPLSAPSVSIPEQLRHTSGLVLTLTVAGATAVTRLSDEIVPYADPVVGLQRRPVHGAPDVTLRLGRALEWIPTRRNVRHPLRVGIENLSTRPQTVQLGFVTPPGVRVDSAPKSVTLEPFEQRDLFLQLRARIDSAKDKQIFGVVARRPGHEPIVVGYQLIQYPHLTPIRLARQSGLWLQPVDVTVPRNLAAVYIPGVSDDVHLALRDVGVNVAVVNAEDFHQVNLTPITTVVLGPRALEAHRELLPQMTRLMDWVRAGGTLVIQRGDVATVHSRAMPFPAAVASRAPERIVTTNAPVTVIFPNARVLKWPNVIRESDWAGWVSGRSVVLPSGADERYVRIIETHDVGQKENQNAILLAAVGKGAVVYSALTLDEQISGGVPGALRLLVNLMSAALPTSPSATARPSR